MTQLSSKLFNSGLTMEFINDYLQSKGIATQVQDENFVKFKLYNIAWDLVSYDGKLILRANFTLDKDTDMETMQKACNAVNYERFCVKASTAEIPEFDEDGKAKPDTLQGYSIHFILETFCETKSEFKKAYEFGLYGIMDAMEFHSNTLNALTAKANAKPRGKKIGFSTNEEPVAEVAEEPAEIKIASQTERKIGFN